jgi:hypothetical protein
MSCGGASAGGLGAVLAVPFGWVTARDAAIGSTSVIALVLGGRVNPRFQWVKKTPALSDWALADRPGAQGSCEDFLCPQVTPHCRLVHRTATEPWLLPSRSAGCITEEPAHRRG